MEKILVENTKLSYEDIGSGEVIVLLHGYPQNHHAWDYQAEELAKNYRVISFDWFGWGESDKNPELDYSYEKEIERLAIALDLIGVDNFNLFAHDYGGFLALGFCLKYPEKVNRLAILNSRAHKTFNTQWYIAFSLIEKIARVPVLSKGLQFLPLKKIHNLGLKMEGIKKTDAYTENFNENEYKIWWQKFFSYYTCKTRPDLIEGLENISCPTTIIWGTKEKYLPEETATELVKKIPDSILVKLEAGHFIMEELPEDVLQTLINLLNRESVVNKAHFVQKDVNLAATKIGRPDYLLILSLILVPLGITVFLYKKFSKKYQ